MYINNNYRLEVINDLIKLIKSVIIYLFPLKCMKI